MTFRERRLASSRYGIVYDIDGPRVRLGVVWFVVAVVGIYLGITTWAVVVAGVAGLAAAQTAKALRTRWRRPAMAVAAGVAAVPPLAASLGAGLAGMALAAGAVLAAVLANVRGDGRSDPIVDSGAAVRAAAFVAVAGSCMVVLHRVDVGAVVMLLLLVSAYECGDYLIGSGAGNVVEGPFSGILAVVVVTAAAAVVQPPPFDGAGLWLYAAVVAVCAPLGQVVASAILPRAGAPAPALRRLDSYLIAGPAWMVLLGSGVGV
jgi:hypothetical protein